MSLELNIARRDAGSRSALTRVAMALSPVALALLGCDGAPPAAEGSPASVVDQVVTFVEDFARQALAAWLL